MKELFEQLKSEQEVSGELFRKYFVRLFSEEVPETEIEDFLKIMNERPVNEEELFIAASVMKSYAPKIELDEAILIDTCGTGGDQSGTFNISTAASLILAAAGVKVAKHGNRALSSQSGSADLLENLGLSIHQNPDEVMKGVRKNNFAFIFAPQFHAATAQVQKVRKKLKLRTLFNLLGPLTNPAPITHQVLGIYDASLLETVAAVLHRLGRQGAWVVHGAGGLDEISLLGPTQVCELKNGELNSFEIHPEDYGLKLCSLEDIAGGSAEENARRLEQIFKGEESASPLIDAILLNVAAALMIVGKVENFRIGLELAQETIESKKALQLIASLRGQS